MIQGRFILREVAHSRGQALIFICCVALSLVSIVAINSFRRDIHAALLTDARNLHGGDILLRSHYSFSPQLNSELERLHHLDGVTTARSWEFYSVARSPKRDSSLLVNIKAVGDTYPLYGHVELRSGRELHQVLRSGSVVVASNLLDRLGLVVGDELLLGNLNLLIVDLIEGESQRPVTFFDFGPRVLVASDDLEAMGLVQQGSRVHYEAMVRLQDKDELESITKRLQEMALPGQERVTTYATAESRVKRFFDNLLFFLSLIAVFTLLLAGMGMQSGLSALFRRKEKSIAVLRSLGATGQYLKNNYITMTLLLSVAGCLLGIFAGGLVKQSFTTLFKDLLPSNITLGFSIWDIVEGMILGLLVTSFFTYLPLASIVRVKPAAVFRHQHHSGLTGHRGYLLIAFGLTLFLGLLVRQLDDLKIGLFFLGGFIVLLGSMLIFIKLILKALPRGLWVPLPLRQAIRSLFRPGNATCSIMVTLASSFAVLLTIELVENNLHKTYIQSYPEDAPNLFCLDIQKNQKNFFLELAGPDVDLYPIIRARLTAVNEKEVNREREMKRRGDTLSREFNLTYRGELLGDEVIKEGKDLFPVSAPTGEGRSGVTSVSVLDSIANIGKMEVGDILTFNIQGVPLKARISSIRARTKSMLYPFFYFVFPENVLEAAPQTFFAALHLKRGELSRFENRVVNAFPNISTINVSKTAEEMGRLMAKLSRVIDFFALFSIMAGGLILVSSILATRVERIEEGVYYKVMGARNRFVLRVVCYENIILALVSGTCAILVAQTASWALCNYIFDIAHDANIFACAVLVMLALMFVVGLGLAASLKVVYKKPIGLLREQ